MTNNNNIYEDLIKVRERLAKVEGSHEDLDQRISGLSDKVDLLKSDITQQIIQTNQENRKEIMEHVDNLFLNNSDSISKISDSVNAIKGGIKVLNSVLIILITLVTGLLGWSQLGDWAWAESKIVLHVPANSNTTISNKK